LLLERQRRHWCRLNLKILDWCRVQVHRLRLLIRRRCLLHPHLPSPYRLPGYLLHLHLLSLHLLRSYPLRPYLLHLYLLRPYLPRSYLLHLYLLRP
jgi:hypothetical protein